jgi:ethanolamine ammonia-lyase small subunit
MTDLPILPAESPPVHADPWADLRRFTSARLALGRAGSSLPTAELLRFGCAHAEARDAVHVPLDVLALQAQLESIGVPSCAAQSAAADRATYLQRPDLGRQLSDADARRLAHLSNTQPRSAQGDVLLVIADGLSSRAVQRHAAPLVEQIRAQAPAGRQVGPVVIATQARVALGDTIGEGLGARLVAVLIGERPGLSSPDSLGIYLTWAPRTGRRDAERNCISNVRPEGLGYARAAHKFWWLCEEAARRGETGIGLKDGSDAALLAAPDDAA